MSLPKPAERRQNRSKRDVGLIALDDATRPVPKPPTGLSKVSREAWTSLWSSALARTFEPASDRPAIERLFVLRDERERAHKATRAHPFIVGSQGQQVLNPLFAHVSRLDAEVRQLEDRFGLTPRARLQLGITFGEAHRSLAELNAAFMEQTDDADDPRATE